MTQHLCGCVVGWFSVCTSGRQRMMLAALPLLPILSLYDVSYKNPVLIWWHGGGHGLLWSGRLPSANQNKCSTKTHELRERAEGERWLHTTLMFSLLSFVVYPFNLMATVSNMSQKSWDGASQRFVIAIKRAFWNSWIVCACIYICVKCESYPALSFTVRFFTLQASILRIHTHVSSDCHARCYLLIRNGNH